ncbi:hypothetical protein F4777DRAFT_571732 [Nemania sp. FL0916]|nr:hypothetical protein F4777DRAFT_571732 [Nemania sp. FL0916]
MAHKVRIDEDITLKVPSNDKCWTFHIIYACGCPMTDKRGLHSRVVRIKQNNHHGPCALRRCIQGSATHKLDQQCDHCQLTDVRFEGGLVDAAIPVLPIPDLKN